MKVLQNRSRIIQEIKPLCDVAYQSGQEESQAISNVLGGIVNPSDKLPFTYPRDVNYLMTYDQKHTERVNIGTGMNTFQGNLSLEAANHTKSSKKAN